MSTTSKSAGRYLRRIEIRQGQAVQTLQFCAWRILQGKPVALILTGDSHPDDLVLLGYSRRCSLHRHTSCRCVCTGFSNYYSRSHLTACCSHFSTSILIPPSTSVLSYRANFSSPSRFRLLCRLSFPWHHGSGLRSAIRKIYWDCYPSYSWSSQPRHFYNVGPAWQRRIPTDTSCCAAGRPVTWCPFCVGFRYVLRHMPPNAYKSNPALPRGGLAGQIAK
jgi:hypothetical protein